MSDHHGIADEGGELRPRRGEGGRLRDRRVVDAVDRGGGGGDGRAGTHQPPECRRLVEPAPGQAHGRDLDQAGGGRIEPGRLGIEHDGIERNERGCVETSHSQPRMR